MHIVIETIIGLYDLHGDAMYRDSQLSHPLFQAHKRIFLWRIQEEEWLGGVLISSKYQSYRLFLYMVFIRLNTSNLCTELYRIYQCIHVQEPN